MIIRQIEQNDAENLLVLVKQIEMESDYMLFGPAERNITLNQQMKLIESVLQARNSTILVAEEGKMLVGYLMAIGGKAKRNRHSAYIVIGILQSERGKGIGTGLFKTLEKWASTREILRLELTVVVENKSAIALYKKVGFEIEGLKKHSLLIDDTFFDEYYMGKLLVN